MNAQVIVQSIKKSLHDLFDLDLWVKSIKENAPHKAGHYLYFGGPGRNRPGPRIRNPIYLLYTLSINSLVSPLGVKRV